MDDNATNRRILALQTAKWGMVVHDTEFPAQAVPMLRQQPFDLAILDMHMPDMDGAMLAKAIRAAGQTLPLVLFSSHGRKEATDSLFAATLAKPLRQSQLFDTLVSLLAHDAAPSAPPPRASRVPDAQMAERHPLRILLAEDNVVNQKLALRLLQQMGYRADVAANGIEAIECCARQPYDVVLMDVQMPEMDGLEASRRIVARWPDAALRPRIIAMTANAMQGDREECLAAGMDDYVTKHRASYPSEWQAPPGCVQLACGRSRFGYPTPGARPLRWNASANRACSRGIWRKPGPWNGWAWLRTLKGGNEARGSGDDCPAGDWPTQFRRCHWPHRPLQCTRRSRIADHWRVARDATVSDSPRAYARQRAPEGLSSQEDKVQVPRERMGSFWPCRGRQPAISRALAVFLGGLIAGEGDPL